MKVRATFIANNQNITALEQAQKRALELTVEALLTEVRGMGVVPKGKGTLELGGTVTIGGQEVTYKGGHVDLSRLNELVVALVFDTPYARRLYWHPEYNFRTDVNPNAQGKWLEPFITGDKKDWVKNTFMFFFKQEAKGLIT